MPRIGVDSGAMIIAPITVAVESVTTPDTAMIPERVSITQKPDRFAAVSPWARSSLSVTASRSLR